MSKIQYPMTTAAIFDDVVYPLHFDNAGKVRQEMEGAVNWFCRWRNEESRCESEIVGQLLGSISES